MRGKVEPWNCRAGQSLIIVRVDGTLAASFPMYSATHDWGSIENHFCVSPAIVSKLPCGNCSEKCNRAIHCRRGVRRCRLRLSIEIAEHRVVASCR